MINYAHWILFGWGLSTSLLMHFWLPDPPPPDVRSYVAGSIAGIIGAVAGASIAGSDPMPGMVLSAAAGTAVLVGLTQVFLRRAR